MSDAFFDWLEGPVADGGVSEVIERTDRLAPRTNVQDGLRLLRDRLLEGTMGIMEAAMGAADIDPSAATPPDEWVEQYGEDGARRRLRIAQYALLPGKEAPVFLGLTQKTMLALMQQDAKSPRETHNHLHLAMVSMPVPVPRELDE